jgi:septum formation protein
MAVAAMPLILASASPQRRAILTQVGIAFEVRPSDVEEDTEGDPAAVARSNARRKAQAVATVAPHALVLGADTVVSAGGAVLGKPADEAHAHAQLERLGGRTHAVLGGFALVEGGELVAAGVERTLVSFRALTPALRRWYVGTGEWRGRAGGYAIQGAGAALVTGVRGDYLNVVGLPLARLLDARPDLLGVG